jgi:hypothetical protein
LRISKIITSLKSPYTESTPRSSQRDNFTRNIFKENTDLNFKTRDAADGNWGLAFSNYNCDTCCETRDRSRAHIYTDGRTRCDSTKLLRMRSEAKRCSTAGALDVFNVCNARTSAPSLFLSLKGHQFGPVHTRTRDACMRCCSCGDGVSEKKQRQFEKKAERRPDL